MRIVLGVAAGIAAYKVVHLARLLKEDGHQVDVIPTPASFEFVGKATWEAISGRPVTSSVFEGIAEVRHVRLGQEADLIVAAPATADLLARARSGMADDLLSSTLLSSQAPKLLVPAMHTEMWQNAATVDNVEVLRQRGITVMEPAVGRLTGKDSGPGRLPEPEEIHRTVNALLAQERPTGSADQHSHAEGPSADRTPAPEAGTGLHHRRVVITAGGTREPLDPVRYLGNRSSGKQGFALAQQAAAAGAAVHLIAGVTEGEPPATPPEVTVERVESAQDLQRAVTRAAPESDVLIMAAAVADFRPADYAEAKIKKTDEGQNPVIVLQRNPDILASVVEQRKRTGEGPAVIVGFAAETGDGETTPLRLAEQKLRRKGCDLLVLNQVGENLVFGLDDTEIHILASDAAQAALGDHEPLSYSGSKSQAAAVVVSRAGELLQQTLSRA